MRQKKSDEDKEEGLVTIPMLNIYKIVETKSGAEVYATSGVKHIIAMETC